MIDRTPHRRLFTHDRIALAPIAVLAALLVAMLGATLGARRQDPEDKLAGVFYRMCSDCHDAQRIVTERRSKLQWEEVLDKMAMKGAQGSDEDFALVLTYLLRHYGRVNVNKAPAEEIATVLDVTPEIAQAIVKYRTDQGPFADFDALAKVPGIDAKKLEQNRAALLF